MFFNPKVIFAPEAATLSLRLGPLTPLEPRSPGKLINETTMLQKCLFSSVLSSKQCIGEKITEDSVKMQVLLHLNLTQCQAVQTVQ